MRGSNFVQGKFHPTNPQKYRGDVNNIVYRSSWELVFFRWCDSEPAILAWNSEETIVPYISGVDGRKHRYFLDATIWAKDATGRIRKKLVEIKPEEQVKKPERRATEKDMAFAERAREWIVNQSKWKAAKEFAQAHDADFVVITEKHLFPQNHSLKRYKQPAKKTA